MKKYEFTDDFYYEFSQLLGEKMQGREYWVGYVDFSMDDVDVMFNASIVVEYTKGRDEETRGIFIVSDVTPIWWSIEVFVDGEDCDHDFDFDNVKEYLIC